MRFVISTPDVQPLLGEKPLPLQQAAAPAPDEAWLPVPASQTTLPLAPDGSDTNGSVDGSGRASRNPFTLELSASALVPRYTFDNFVVGKSNRLAQAGASMSPRRPAKCIIPCFYTVVPAWVKRI